MTDSQFWGIIITLLAFIIPALWTISEKLNRILLTLSLWEQEMDERDPGFTKRLNLYRIAAAHPHWQVEERGRR